MLKILIVTVLISVVINLQAQSLDEIKANSSTYLWGEGSGMTIKGADKEALAMLISQISTQVVSSFTLLKNEMLQNGNSDEFNETFHSVIKTYSGATLKNTERIVVENEPDAKVFRYIKREEITKVFKKRKEKIIGFVNNAEEDIAKFQVADALRYYYWALTLLKSHPDGSSIEYVDEFGKKHQLATWIPMQINNIFAAIDINVVDKEVDPDYAMYTLKIKYKNIEVQNFDYCYWTGSDWSNLVSAKDGVGLIELYGVSASNKKIKIKAEYIFDGEARIDHELEDVLSKVDPVPFRSSYYNVSLTLNPIADKFKVKESTVQSSIKNAPLTEVADVYPYKQCIEKILRNIKIKNYTAIKSEFTSDGYTIFTKLINYGNAKNLTIPELKYIAFENEVICRSIPMCFNFKNNNKKIVENVVFHFNNKGKVEDVSFGLSKIALNDIINKTTWSERDRMILVNFLENYKTAYALKRINYIAQIFSDDALIITGKVVKVQPNELNCYKGNKIVKYNRQTKRQYIKNLRYSFDSKEYVNLKFEESKIRKSGKGGNVFGVEIKQNYYSDNYGDVGYLFLLVDLTFPSEPIIHVRTWQPKVGINDTVYGMGDFD